MNDHVFRYPNQPAFNVKLYIRNDKSIHVLENGNSVILNSEETQWFYEKLKEEFK